MPAPFSTAYPGDARVPTGTPELDQILNGGLLARRPYLIVGPAGTGKTTLALQFLCEGIRRGENCLIVTLEEPPNEMRSNHPGLSPELERVFVFDAIPDVMRYERTPFKDIAAVRQSVPFGQVPLEIRRTPELSSVEVTFTALEQTLKMEAARRPYSRLVIDSLTALQYFCMKGVDETIGAQTFLRFLSDLRITTILTVESPLEDVETAERLLARGEVRLFRWELDGKTVRAIGVEKFRGSEHDIRLHPYRITPHGLAINLGVTISRDTRQILEVGPGPPAAPVEPREALAELDASTAFSEFLRRDLDGVLAAHGDLEPIRSAVGEAARAVAAGDPVSAWAALRAARRLADQQLDAGDRPKVPLAQLDAGPPPLARIRELVAQVADLIGPIPVVAPTPVAPSVPIPATVQVPAFVPPSPAATVSVTPAIPSAAPGGATDAEPPAPPPTWPTGLTSSEPALAAPTVEAPPLTSSLPVPTAHSLPPASAVTPTVGPARAGGQRTPLGRTASRIANVFSRGSARHPDSYVPSTPTPVPAAPAGTPALSQAPPVAVPEAPPLPRPREEPLVFENLSIREAPPVEAPPPQPVPAVIRETEATTPGPESTHNIPEPVEPTSAVPALPPPPPAEPSPAPPLAPVQHAAPPAPEPAGPPAPSAPVVDPAASAPAEATAPAPKRRRRAPGTATPRRRTPPVPPSPAPSGAAPSGGPQSLPAADPAAPTPAEGSPAPAEPPVKVKRRAPRKRKAPTVVYAAAGTGPPGSHPTPSAPPAAPVTENPEPPPAPETPASTDGAPPTEGG